MRGDSIRDRYAKGLALLGLGMLAGTGAVVDYWPAGMRLPLVPPAEREPLQAQGLPAVEDPFTVVIPLPAALDVAAQRVTPLPVLHVEVEGLAAVAGQPVTMTALRPALEPPAEPAPSQAPMSVLASADRAPEAAVTIGEPAAVAPAAPPSQSVSALGGESEEDGFFVADAVKRTSASIARTGARAGLSVFDAFRSLGGAMRRALPN